MRRVTGFLLFSLTSALLPLLACAPAPENMTGNPILRAAADPHAAAFDGRFYIYPTSGRGRFFAYVSDDLRTWKNTGTILDLRDVEWTGTMRNAWAPGIFKSGGKYYFYYSVGNEPISYIGVAVGDSPSGPFKDSGKPLLDDTTQDGNSFEAIDPMVFRDPKTGKVYLYAGGSRGATMRVFEMNDDLVSLGEEVDIEQPPNFTEGAFMHERDGIYYLSWSFGRWFDDSYTVHYATADSPIGPWNHRGVILEKNDEDKGPGHHSFMQDPVSGQWYIVYHRWENRRGEGPYRGPRSTAIETIEYDSNGLIRPIQPTNDGVPLVTRDESN